MASEKVNQLQLLQQNLQNVFIQKQQIESQLVELNSAVSGLKSSEQAYKIVGKIMVAAPNEQLSRELQEKKEIIELRLKNFTKHEEKLKQNIEELQKEVVRELQKQKQKK